MASAEHGPAQPGRAEDIRLLVDTIPVSVWLTRPDGSAEFFNQRWLEYTGLPREQALDWGWKVAIHPEDLPRMLETFHEALNLRRSFEVEGRFRRWDGEFRWFLFRGTPLLDGSGDVLKWYGTNTDLEDRKRAEEKLRRSEADLLDAQRMSRTGSLKVDIASGTVTGSPQVFRIFGVMPGEDTSTPEFWLGRTHPDDQKRVRELFDRSITQKTDFDADYRIVLPDGAIKYLHSIGHPSLNESGDLVEFGGTIIDITDRKQAEAFLAREKRILEMVATGDPLPQILDIVCRFVEEQASGALASILLLDGNRLRHGGAPSLPKAYTDAIDGARTGLSAGSCGRAAYLGEQVIVEDIATEPLWANYREAALPHSLRACWSTPIFSSQGKVIATFALYYREPRSPSPHDQETIKQTTHLAGVAIERKLTQEALQRSEHNLNLIINTIPALAWSARPDGSADFFNQHYLEFVGLSAEQVQGWGWTVAVHPDDLNSLAGAWHSIMVSGKAGEAEARLRRFDGVYRWFLFRANPLYNESGDIVEWFGINTDIEDRKRVEEKLQRSEADLLEAQRISQTGSWKLDVSSGTVTGSPQMLRIYGVKPDEDTSNFELWFGRTHPEDRKRMLDLFERSKNQKTDYEADYRIVLPDGAVKHIHTNGHPVLNDSGDVVEFVGTNMEITERKHAEEALWRSEGYLADARRLAHIGVWARNVGSSNSVYRSQEIYRLFGFDPESGLPSDQAFYRRIHPEDRDKVSIKAFHERTPKGADFDLEFRVVLPDGGIKYIRSAGHPVRDMSGEVTEYIGISMDVTERKRAEDELRASEYRHRHIFQANYVSIWEEDWSLVKAAIDDLKAQGIRDFRQYVEAHPEFVRQTIAMVKVLDVNEATVRLFGAQRKEQLLSSFDRIFASQAEDFFAEELVAIADGQTSFETETVLRTLQGDEIAVLFTITFPQPSTLETVLVSIIDITQRKQAEEKIREQEIELRQILDAAPLQFVVLGSDGSRLYVNQFSRDFRGCTLEEYQKHDFREHVHPDDAERFARERKRAMSTASPLEIEARLARHDGKYRWFLFRYKPLKDQRGRLTRWVVLLIDIDDRKQSEEKLQHENVVLREEIDKASMFERIVGTSPALQTVLSRVSKVAATDSSVLITGETGTGKELVARAIHRRSKRSSGPFISMNCAAIPRDLIPSELFGHEKGAFTGATQQRLGRFELADGGTIFLDEVGEIPAETQIALLRVLQENEFERVGGVRSIRTDVRVVAATNRDLQTAIAAGTFRSDLFYRLNVFPIEVPPLRERREDIPLLVEYFIDRYARKAGKSFRAVNRKTLDLLQAYSWAGNIRELQNVIERSVIVCDTEEFSVDESWLSRSPLGTETKSHMDLSRRLATQEKEMIEAALRESGGRVSGRSGAAAKLGIPGPTLESKIRSLKIDKYRFKPAVSSPGRIK